MIDELTFRKLADTSLEQLQRALEKAADTYEFEVDRNEGALTVEFEDPPARFVVSPNAPVKQIWVSAHMKSYKLDWDPERRTFVTGGKTLVEIIDDAVGKQLGTKVEL